MESKKYKKMKLIKIKKKLMKKKIAKCLKNNKIIFKQTLMNKRIL